jgi:hypothetical protein
MAIGGAYSSTYDTPADLLILGGTYNGISVTAAAYKKYWPQTTPTQTTAVVIDGSGNLSGTVTMENQICVLTGALLPRANGKNIFDIHMTYTGNDCSLGNGTTTNGVAMLDNGTKELIAMTLNSSRNDGMIFVVSR